MHNTPAHPRAVGSRPAAAACACRTPARAGGFTLIELVVTLTLVSVLALVAVPLYEVTVTHSKESELRSALRQIRDALDAYKAAADNGVIARDAASSGYPPNLKILVEGVDTIMTPVNGGNGPAAGGTPSNGAPGFSNGSLGAGAPAPGQAAPGAGSGFGAGSTSAFGAPASGAANSITPEAIPTHMVWLRQVPRDPFFEDQSVAADLQWNLRAYGALPGDFGAGADVYDISSKSTATGLNGIAYKDW